MIEYSTSMLILTPMVTTESLLLLRSIALTGQTEGMVFSLQQLLLFILLNDFALLALLAGAFIALFAVIYMPKEE
jgi:hypothetical protein